MTELSNTLGVWSVGALCRAIADALDARFNPVSVGGEITGFSRAASGHCYFSLKDESGQLRCAMFRRSAAQLKFVPGDGARVEVHGRVAVYEPRGELQLVVESMRPSGQGVLYEEFLRLKAKLAQEGLFETGRKRQLPLFPSGIGVVTSLGAAALHDVVTALQRRVPHLSVIVAPASVQGENAPGELMTALRQLYALAGEGSTSMDVVLLVRGGGSMEDLWAYNDEALARTIAESPVPVITGVGHETDFTIADFVADVRAPTPTAAAELVCQPTHFWLAALDNLEMRLRASVVRRIDQRAQRLDGIANRLGRPSSLSARQCLRLESKQQRLRAAVGSALQMKRVVLERSPDDLRIATRHRIQSVSGRLDRADLRLRLLDPTFVLKRGYAWLTDARGKAVGSVAQASVGQTLTATLVDGVVGLSVLSANSN